MVFFLSAFAFLGSQAGWKPKTLSGSLISKDDVKGNGRKFTFEMAPVEELE